MATSSIFANVIINNEESAAAIADAFEKFEANGAVCRKVTTKLTLDPEKIKSFFFDMNTSK